jgi:hypothetical protein
MSYQSMVVDWYLTLFITGDTYTAPSLGRHGSA